jgi:hypothetical protein
MRGSAGRVGTGGIGKIVDNGRHELCFCEYGLPALGLNGNASDYSGGARCTVSSAASE